MDPRLVVSLYLFFVFEGVFLLHVTATRRCQTWRDLFAAIRNDQRLPRCQIAARPTSIKQDDGEADTVAAMETTTDTHVEVDTARRDE